VVTAETDLVRLAGRPNFRSLGARYGKRTPAVAALVERLGPDLLRRLEAGETVDLSTDEGSVEYQPGDVTVERMVATDWPVQSDGPLVAAIDPALDDDLRQEGLARELVNRIQRLRKDAGYQYTTRIALAVAGAGPVLDAVRAHRDFICGETLARRLDLGEATGITDRTEDLIIEHHAVTIAVGRLADGDGAAQH